MKKTESVISTFNRSRLRTSKSVKNLPVLHGLSYKILTFIVIASNTINIALGEFLNDSNKTSGIYPFIAIDRDTDYVFDSMENSKRIYENLTINTPIEKSFRNNTLNGFSDSGDNVTLFNMNDTVPFTTITSELNTNRTIDGESTSSPMVNDQNNYWALSALILVVGTAAGNILVCLAIAWERRLQNVTNYFLMSLAITDLMVAILVMPFGILTLFKGEFIISLFVELR